MTLYYDAMPVHGGVIFLQPAQVLPGVCLRQIYNMGLIISLGALVVSSLCNETDSSYIIQVAWFSGIHAEPL